jgi:hypothetical protein
MKRALVGVALALVACPAPAERGTVLANGDAGTSGSGTSGSGAGGTAGLGGSPADAGSGGASGTGGVSGASGQSGVGGKPAFSAPDVAWGRTFATSADEQVSALAMSGTQIVATGTFKSSLQIGTKSWVASGPQGVFVARLDGGDGGVVTSALVTATGFANVFGLGTDGAGRVYVAGHLSGMPNVVPKTPGLVLPPFAKTNAAFLARLTDSGVFDLFRTFPGATDISSLVNVAPLADGAIVVGTFLSPVDLGVATLSPIGGADTFVARVDDQGAVLWAVQLGGPGSEVTPSVAVRDGLVLVAGLCGPDLSVAGAAPVACDGLYLQALDLQGGLVFRKTYAVAEAGYPTVLAPPGTDDVWLTGQFTGKVSFGGSPLVSGANPDLFVARLGPDGSHRRSGSFGDGGTQLLRAAAVDAAGRLVVAGATRGAIPLPSGKLTPTPNDQNAYVFALDADLASPWGLVIPSDGTNQTQIALGLATDAGGATYLGASFHGTITLGGAAYPAQGGADALVVKLVP